MVKTKMTSLAKIKKEFDKKFLGFTIPDTKEGRFTASLYWDFIQSAIQNEKKEERKKVLKVVLCKSDIGIQPK